MNVARCPFALVLCLLVSSIVLAAPPNIVIITGDNIGYSDLGCYGNDAIKTPNIDRLATEGVRCTSFYTASPTCTVSRASLLTGRVPQRHGLTEQLPGIEGNYGIGLPHREKLIPQYLKEAGYVTGCFGKWNIGFAEGSRPTERGFDQFFGHASGNIDYYTHVYAGKHDLFRGTEEVHVEGYSTDLFADAACDFIEANAKQPFFAYLPFNAPHFPSARNKAPGMPNTWQAPDWAFEAYGWSPDEPDPKRRYYAVMTALDAAVGRVLKQIDDAGIRDNTIVVFYSDNGAFMLKDRGLEVSNNKPLRDGGVTLWEGGIRVAATVRWPGEIPAGSESDVMLWSPDLLSMCLEVSGVPEPADRILDGKNPLPSLRGEAGTPHEFLAYEYRQYKALRRGDQKVIYDRKDKQWHLFDLGEDLGETTDLAGEKPEVAAELQAQFARWREGTATF
jgi:arylsulfatase A